jgi:hypothetical protein
MSQSGAYPHLANFVGISIAKNFGGFTPLHGRSRIGQFLLMLYLPTAPPYKGRGEELTHATAIVPSGDTRVVLDDVGGAYGCAAGELACNSVWEACADFGPYRIRENPRRFSDLYRPVVTPGNSWRVG